MFHHLLGNVLATSFPPPNPSRKRVTKSPNVQSLSDGQKTTTLAVGKLDGKKDAIAGYLALFCLTGRF